MLKVVYKEHWVMKKSLRLVSVQKLQKLLAA